MGKFFSLLLSSRGVASVEYAAIVIPFFSSLFFVAELSRLIFLSSALDLVLAESASSVSIRRGDINDGVIFNQEINEHMQAWPLFSKPVIADVNIYYCASVQDVIEAKCISGNRTGMPLALYTVSVDYKPTWFIFPGNFIRKQLTRNIVLVQETQLARE